MKQDDELHVSKPSSPACTCYMQAKAITCAGFNTYI